MQLSDQGYMGLGIYIGYKPAYRKREMERHGVDYDAVVIELTKAGIIKSGRINLDRGWFC